eukprot:scaffold40_cov305-Pinguiococcus_pyrenoidosus.AAC.18
MWSTRCVLRVRVRVRVDAFCLWDTRAPACVVKPVLQHDGIAIPCIQKLRPRPCIQLTFPYRAPPRLEPRLRGEVGKRPRRRQRSGRALGPAASAGRGLERLHLLGDGAAVVCVGGREVRNRSLLDELLGIHEVPGDVAREAVSFLRVQHAAVELAALREVVLVAGLVAHDVARGLRRVPGLLPHHRRSGEAVGEVVGRATLVGVHRHGAVALVVGDLAGEWAVHGDRLIVRAQAVAVRVRVGEEPALEHLIRRRLDAGDHVRRREGQLLHLGEVVLRVAVQHEAAHLDERVVLVRPDLGHVERVEGAALRLLVAHDLDVHRPAGRLSVRDGVVEVSDRVVRIGSLDLRGLLRQEVADALVRLEVVLHVHGLPVRIDVLEGVRAIAIHVAIAVGRAAVGEQERHLVRGLRAQRDEVPEGIRVLQMRARVALLRVNEAGEEDGVSDEEDGRVVAHEVPVAFLRVELHGVASRVPRRIRRAGLAAHGRKAHCHGRPLPKLVEEGCSAVLLHWGKRHKLVMSRPPLISIHCPLGLPPSGLVTSKYPNAPAPLACTTRSGILSRSKCARESTRLKSFVRKKPSAALATPQPASRHAKAGSMNPYLQDDGTACTGGPGRTERVGRGAGRHGRRGLPRLQLGEALQLIAGGVARHFAAFGAEIWLRSGDLAQSSRDVTVMHAWQLLGTSSRLDGFHWWKPAAEGISLAEF